MIHALAIETSSRIGAVALVRDGRILASETFPHGLAHAARIVPAIENLSRPFSLKAADLSEIYVSAGPGSFTGLRIGITLAKTLAWITRARLVAVSSVEVLAQNAPSDAHDVLIVIDAKRGQIFTARFHRQTPATDSWRIAEPAHLDTLAAMLARAPRPIHLLGEGIAYHRDAIPNEPDILITPESAWQPRVEAVAQLGWASARLGQFVEPERFIPIYIRKPEAEEKWENAAKTNQR